MLMKMTARSFTFFAVLFVAISLHAATITWTNTAGGNWSDATSWSPNQVPGSSDDAVITADGSYTVTLDVNPTVAGLVLGGTSGDQIFSFNGQTFTLNGQATINSNGTFTLNSGALAGTNAVISGLWTWTGGSIAGGSTLTVATNGVLLVTGGTYHYLSGVLTNAGTIQLANNSYLVCDGNAGGGQLINLPGALVDIQDDSTIYYSGYAGEEVVNQGTIRKSGGTGISYFDPPLYNSGTLDVQSGTVSLSGGNGNGQFIAEAGATLVFPTSYEVDSALSGAGTNLLQGGTFTLNGDINGQNVFLVSSTLMASNAVINSALTWTGGSIAGGSTLTVATNGVLLVTGDTYQYLYGVLTNAGTIQLTNNSYLVCSGNASGGQLINLPGALVDIQDDSTIYYGGYSSEEVFNQGTIRKSGGTGVSYIDPPLYNSGTLDVQSGTVSLSGGNGNGQFIAEAGATLVFPTSYEVDSALSGAGTNLLQGGTFTLNGDINGQNVFLVSSTLMASNAVINSALTWTGGSIAGGSTLTVATNGVLLVTGGTYQYLYGVLTNAGTIQLTNNSYLVCNGNASGGQLINLPGALVDIQDDSTIYYSGYAGEEVVNQGTIRKSGGTGVSYIYPPLYNSGMLDAQSGTVSLGGGNGNGQFIAEAGATLVFPTSYEVDSALSGAGTNLLQGGTFTLNGSINGQNVFLVSSTLMASNAVINSALTWTGGSIAGGSTLTVATNGVLLVTGDTYQDLYGVLTNAGTIQLTNNSYLVCSGNASGGQLINLPGALVDIQDDSTIYYGGYSSEEVFNQGTIRKSGGTGVSYIDPPLYNSGTLDAQSGTVSLGGGYSLTNGMLNFGINSLTNFGVITLSGNPAALAGSVSANFNNGYVAATGSSFPILTYSSQTGNFTNFNLPFTVAWQTNYGSTAFTLTVLNVRPTLTLITSQTVNELTALSVTNSATDPDPGQTLTFALVSAPNGMTINSGSGIISWTPAQTQSPSTNTIAVSVTDNGTPPLSATNSFNVIVKEVNVAPTLPVIPTNIVNELALLSVTNTATNFNIHSTITGYTLVSPPTGMTINASGIITWTPAQTQSPSTNTITTVVTNSNPYDTINPSLTSTNTFTVIVKEVNVAPTLPVIATQTVNELTLLSVTNTATNFNVHSTITGYTLVNPPTGMTINASGIISWTPAQTQSPSTNTITTVVTNSNPFDTINPSLTSTNTFTVIVKEVNVAPTMPVIATQTVNELALLSVTNTANNSNIHSTVTGYGLVNPPTGMTISASGVISWTPAQTQSPSTNTITTVVTNNNPYDTINPSLTSTNTFMVIVKEVNVAPTMPVIATQTVNELTLLSVTNTANNFNIHSTITGYTLVSPPTGMTINASGIISWTPAQTQSPSTNTITTVVTNSNPFDTINPSLTSTNTFTVIVKEVNVAPTLPVIATQTVNELALLSVTNTANNSNIHSTITGYTLVSPPTGMTINASGVISWTPAQTQSPSTNTITTVVTNSNPYDTINPSLTSTNIFTVIVTEVNVAPTLPVIATQTVNELALLSVTNTATNFNIHSTITGYTLVSPPTGMTINASGVISWTPAQTQSPSTNTITTVVTNSNPFDTINPSLTSTNTFTVIVKEVNVAPTLPVIATQTVNELALLSVTNTANNSNIHSTITGYTLVSPPTGMTINASGIITWTPAQTQSPSTNTITTVVTNGNPYDAVNPQLTATNSFAVIVLATSTNAPGPISISSITMTNIGGTNGVLLRWYAPTNDLFQVRWTPRLPSSSWNLFTNIVNYTGPVTATNGWFMFFDNGSQSGGLGAARFYQLLLANVSSVTNRVPVLPDIPTQSVTELALLTITNTATESDIHAAIGYTLAGPPAGMSVNASGIITWTPDPGQALTTNTVTVVVTSTDDLDPVNPQLSATNSFMVIVNETNIPPVLPVIPAQMVEYSTLLTVADTATESNPQAVISGYLLVNPPAGMSISAGGIITWTPAPAQSPYTYTITTIVTNLDASDRVHPSLSATNSFTVTVSEQPGLWSEEAPLPVAEFSPVVASLNGALYVAGGNNGSGPLPGLYSYNPALNTWNSLASMPGARYQIDGFGVISNNLYAAGGWTYSPALPNNNLWAYSTVTNTWSTHANMPYLSGDGACGVISNQLYVVTTDDGYNGWYNFLAVYNPAHDTWTQLPLSPNAHGGPGYGVISNKFYVVGGAGDSGVVTGQLDVYDPASNTWTTKSPMPTARGSCASAVLNGKLYVIGGVDASGNVLNVVEVYNPVTDSWATNTPMPTPRGNFAAGVVNGTIYCVGGFNSVNGGTILSANEAYTPTVIAPAITNQVASLTSSFGGATTLSVGISGTSPFTYQWALNGTNISGATNAILSLANLSITNLGFYTVAVSNSSGGVVSAPIDLFSLGLNRIAGPIIYGSISTNYNLQSTPALGNSANWTTLTNINLPSLPYIYIDYSSVTNPRQFYRTASADAGPNPASLVMKLFPQLTINGPAGTNYDLQSAAVSGGITNWTTLTNFNLASLPFIYLDYSVATNSQPPYRVVPGP